MKLVFGIGINDKKYPSVKDGKLIKEYDLWKSMLRRVFKDKSYVGCSISENFKSYSYFYEWCQDQIGFGMDRFELDKDLLKKGNKIYSEDMCVFIPKEINILLTKSNAARGSNPIGVSFCKDRGLFQVAIKKGGKRIALGRYNCPNHAFTIYKKAKEDHVKSIAETWKHHIDPRAYEALMNYSVEITD